MNKKTLTKLGNKTIPTGKVKVTMYDVGFGDCFLLSFPYSDGKSRHVLIDCGSSTERKDRMKNVALQIAKDCDGHLHGLVVTHRHSDHLSAFGLKDVGDILEKLQPEVVVQPWTEHPQADAQAKTAPSVFSDNALTHLDSLYSAQQFAERLTKNLGNTLVGASPALQKRLAFITTLSIPNKPAIQRLERMGKGKGRLAAYVYAGTKSGLERVLPGIQISVLGPPTLAQSAKIKNPSDWDPSEFWKFQAGLVMSLAGNRLQTKGRSTLILGGKTASITEASSNLKWVISRLDKAHTQNIQRFVRVLDGALNNTSVILLFELNNKAMLFPGDAQLENWQYALQDSQNKKLLQKSNLYKVGHHGSTNATPKSLWALFANRSPQLKPDRLITLLSTKHGKHENVPRESLVTALKNESNLNSTEDFGKTNKLSQPYDV